MLSPALSNIQTEIGKLTGSPGSAINTAKTSAASAKTSMQTMPTGANTLEFTQTYAYPLHASVTTGTVSTVLGPKIGIFSNTTSLLGDIYDYVTTLEANLTTITSAASGVNPHITTADMGARITATDTILTDVQTSLDGMKGQVEKMASYLADADSYNTCLLYTSPSPRDQRGSRMPSSA